MAKRHPFLQDESGQVSVNFAVLAAGLAGLAASLAWLYADRIGQLNFNIGARVQERETRPSYAYVPYDILLHDHFKSQLSTLNDEDLEQLSSWGNATREERAALPEEQAGVLDDFDNAITIAHGERYKSRGADDSYNEAEVGRIFEDLGYGSPGAVATAG
ncbi:hypothetical protein MWU52_09630 [Jannaschia sp. S6380]|uniref:hypothetical protein n=1 Tax=Jannaschia sp. S6380 TaxID=2926408 RepID=UPI001FF1B4A0|nr:hypothetical protein [Jannaschia sp. S6380]MCK0167806.1 hypothetical protein [Jannaschia sp. S6380]